MGTLASSSSSVLFSSAPSNLSPPSLSLSSSSHFCTLSSSLSTSTSHSFLTHPATSRRFNHCSFSIKANAGEKKKVLIVNTNSGGHVVIGFYFAKELLGSGWCHRIDSWWRELGQDAEAPIYQILLSVHIFFTDNTYIYNTFCISF